VLKKIVAEQGGPIDYAYFPTRGMVSAVTLMSNGAGIEVGTVGPEGVSPVTAAVGVLESPLQCIVQLPGEGWRIKATKLAAACADDEPLRQLMVKYYSYFLYQVSQSVACNGLHSIAQRCSRWLLISQDRAKSDDIKLTHEYLAMMLGVRRPSVTLVLQPLQEQGLIKGGRGSITILDRRAMEVTACECYQKVRDEYARLIG
jgi:CRP-like cAMP-binding protein